MALPAQFNTGTVTGKIVNMDGSVASGTITFEPRVNRIVVGAAQTIVIPRKAVATLDAEGAFSIELPATNDPDVSPLNFTYKVTENLSVGNGSVYEIAVPVGETVDISTILTGVPASGGAVIARGEKGEPGPAGDPGPVGPPFNAKASVANAAALPGAGNTVNDFRVAQDTGIGHAWTGSAWIEVGTYRGPEGPPGPELGDAGLLSARPAASSVTAGYHYHATDEGVTYIKNGALGGGSWAPLADPAGTTQEAIDALPEFVDGDRVVWVTSGGTIKPVVTGKKISGGISISNSTAETSLIGGPWSLEDLSNNTALDFEIFGALTNNSGATADVTIKIKIGAIVATYLIDDMPSAAGGRGFALLGVANTFSFLGTDVAAVGGRLSVGALTNNAADLVSICRVSSAGAVTNPMSFDVTLQFSAASASLTYLGIGGKIRRDKVV